MITTTTDHIEGYRITEYLGVVFAKGKDMYGHHPYLNDPDTWESPIVHNADAIIGIQYATSAYGSGSGGGHTTHVVIGTAVNIEKI